jgi:hypothetical protein
MTEPVIRERIKLLTQELASMTEGLPEGASELPDAAVSALVELEDLHNELKALGDAPDSGEPDAFLCAPLTPLPHLNSGSIALPEPEVES